MTDTQQTDVSQPPPEETEEPTKPKRRSRAKKGNGDQPGLKQISTERREREGLPLDQTEALKSREAKGWTPQSGPSGPVPVEPVIGGQTT